MPWAARCRNDIARGDCDVDSVPTYLGPNNKIREDKTEQRNGMNTIKKKLSLNKLLGRYQTKQ